MAYQQIEFKMFWIQKVNKKNYTILIDNVNMTRF